LEEPKTSRALYGGGGDDIVYGDLCEIFRHRLGGGRTVGKGIERVQHIRLLLSPLAQLQVTTSPMALLHLSRSYAAAGGGEPSTASEADPQLS
jgi:hypothetical protein